MTVRIRLSADRQKMKQVALLAGIGMPLLMGAALLRSSEPKAFDFTEFERERALARLDAQRSLKVEAAEANQPSLQVKDLDKRINGAVTVFGVANGVRR